MKPRNTLFVGISLLLLGAFTYAFSGVLVTVYTVSSGSYWTYYEYQYATHSEYQCAELGVSTLCAFLYHLAYSGAATFFLAGIVMMAVSLHRILECPRST